jgi:NTP pyrophosphatase (non-canonical NTP hydrolase)
MLSQELVEELLSFRRARNWEQFHSARNLATALSVEASELLEHFNWASDADIPRIVEARRSLIAEEIADVAMLLTYLGHDLGINIELAVSAKLAANGEKYPVAKSFGSNKKYTEL